MNFNKLLLGGRLTKDPELRVTPGGTAITQFSVATSRKFKTDNQEREEVSFIDCEAWGKTGEAIAKYLSKGKPIFCEGRIKQDSWEDKTTKEKRTKLKMVVEIFQFVGSREDGGQTATAPAQQAADPTAPSFRKETAPADEDVPF